MPSLAPVGDFVQVTVAMFHACALGASGVATCWGNDLAAAATAVPDARFRQIDAAYGVTCGILLDGSVRCWGDGSLVSQVPAGEFVEIDLYGTSLSSYACGVSVDGSVACWGDVPSPEADESGPVPLASLADPIGPATGGSCTDPDGGDATTAGLTAGKNGEFQDHCDSQGNLVEYTCEQPLFCPGADDGARCAPSGRVTASNIPCGGRCAVGSCPSSCLAVGDEVRAYMMVSGFSVDLLEGFSCDVRGEDTRCASEIELGTLRVAGVELLRPCTGGYFGLVDLGPTVSYEHCWYACAPFQ